MAWPTRAATGWPGEGMIARVTVEEVDPDPGTAEPATRSPRGTAPPPGRLVRLGVVVPADTPSEQLGLLAGVAAAAGVGVIWVDARDGTDPWTALAVLAARGTDVGLGVHLWLAPGHSPVSPPEGFPAGLDVSALGRPLELSILGDDQARVIDATHDLRREIGPRWVIGREWRPSGHAADGPATDGDDLVVVAGEDRPLGDTLARLGRHLDDGAPLERPGVAVLAAASIGRTTAEAEARASLARDHPYGHPKDVGLFGTLEQVHAAVVALARAGVTDLRCTLPTLADVADAVGQLTAATRRP